MLVAVCVVPGCPVTTPDEGWSESWEPDAMERHLLAAHQPREWRGRLQMYREVAD